MDEKETTETLIKKTLLEDIGRDDVTTSAILNKDQSGSAIIIAKQDGILAGINYANMTFSLLDSEIELKSHYNNGDEIYSNDWILQIKGKLSTILKGERTALNLLAHLSGISTLTARYVRAIRGSKAKITDTRKTTPLWRKLEKEAVRVGGGVNHRMGLYDMVLIKENHIEAAAGLQNAVDRCKKYLTDSKLELKIEVETTNLEQVKEAVACGVDQIMLDNMDIKEMIEAVGIVAGRAITEASGGISLENVKSIADTGVDLISIGALTHSASAFDYSLLVNGL